MLNLLIIAFSFHAVMETATVEFGLDRDPVCVVEHLLQGDIAALTGEGRCPWSGERAFAEPLGLGYSVFSFWNGPRTHNLTKAARLIDGVVLSPGERFSFNETTGDRSLETGYRKATIIGAFGFRKGVGGGVCQVSGALHTAALDAGLIVEERWAHRLRIKYLPPGLDATVDYGKKDLKLRNPYPFPVRLEMGVMEKGELLARVMAPVKLLRTRYRYKVMDLVPSDSVRFKVVSAKEAKDLVKYYGRPSARIRRQFMRSPVWSRRWHKFWLEEDEYDASPWILRVTELPEGKRSLTGLSQKAIGRLMKGTRYTPQDGVFRDLRKPREDWEQLTYISRGKLKHFKRFNDARVAHTSRVK